MDIAAVRAALGRAPASVPAVLGKSLTCTTYTPLSVNVPCFHPLDVELRYADVRNTFGGQPVVEAVCLLLTGAESDPEGGQALLDAYLSHPSSTSVKAAVESDQSLGGIAKSVFVHDIDGYRLFTVGQNLYYGARLRVLVLGG